MQKLEDSKFYQKNFKGLTKPGDFLTQGELSSLLRYYHHYLKPNILNNTSKGFCLACFAFTRLKSAKAKRRYHSQRRQVTYGQFFGYENGSGTFATKFIKNFKKFILESHGVYLWKKGYIRFRHRGKDRFEDVVRSRIEAGKPMLTPGEVAGLGAGGEGLVVELMIRRPWFNIDKECLDGVGGAVGIGARMVSNSKKRADLRRMRGKR